jgi:hypothetical protein
MAGFNPSRPSYAMSALGQKQTFLDVRFPKMTSALPLPTKADICGYGPNVR